MSNTKTVMSQAANTQGIPLDITDVFSTYLYTGDSTNPSAKVNGIDLAGEGGMVWLKSRTGAYNHYVADTEQPLSSGGGATWLYTNTTDAALGSTGTGLMTFNSDGFSTFPTGVGVNASGNDYASWTFRKAPKFFDVVTWTGTGGIRAINHNLGSVPGMIIVKWYNVSTDNWTVYHRGLNGGTDPEDYGIYLNVTNAAINDSGFWNDTAPTSTQFTVGGSLNSGFGGGGQYVAYLFAHNDGDGEFGPDGDQDIIKCGSYTGNGSTNGPEIDLGFEPQWVVIKRADSSAGWFIMDNMRGMAVGNGATGNTYYVNPNNSNAEDVFSSASIDPTSTGFNANGTNTNVNASGGTYIYIAIRRGPLAPPESATEVFAAVKSINPGDPTFISGFPVDMSIHKDTTGGESINGARLIQDRKLRLNSSAAEGSGNTEMMYDHSNGFYSPIDYGSPPGAIGSVNFISYMWKRAPKFFDVVAYTGTGSVRTVPHNLGVAPELMIFKARNTGSDNWFVYAAPLGPTKGLYLNATNSAITSPGVVNDTAPTESVFSTSAAAFTNINTTTYIAYLFASLPGISKVGSYTGNGTSQTIDCGFTSGARFVLIKSTTQSQPWFVFDSTRGIVAGNDSYLQLNSTVAENELGAIDVIDPHNSGFIVNTPMAGINNNNETYIFYAIA